MTVSDAANEALVGVIPIISFEDVAYYLERIRQECGLAAGAQTAEVARVHLNFAAHYLRSVSAAVERRHADADAC